MNFSLEYALFEKGYSAVGGIDEAGRGCLAGPVVAAVVVITGVDQYVEGVFDSKLMTRKSREAVFSTICEKSASYGIGEVSAEEVDSLGISAAAAKAMSLAYHQLKTKPDLVIVDGKHIRAPVLPGVKVNKADRLHYLVSAASVLAKVYRDRLMVSLAEEYPKYGFERHVGYGTKVHMEALAKYGVCKIHRRTYAPVRRILEGKR